MFQLQISVRKADGSGILQESQSNSDGKSRHQENIFIQKQERPKQIVLYVLTPKIGHHLWMFPNIVTTQHCVIK